jgi:hypothetical protein
VTGEAREKDQAVPAAILQRDAGADILPEQREKEDLPREMTPSSIIPRWT